MTKLLVHRNFVSLLVQRLFPWVGLRKINVSYWGWEDASPFTNTTLRWSPGEPSDSGFCAYLEQAQVAGLKANPCTAIASGLICEKPAGENRKAKKCNETGLYSLTSSFVTSVQLLLDTNVESAELKVVIQCY